MSAPATQMNSRVKTLISLVTLVFTLEAFVFGLKSLLPAVLTAIPTVAAYNAPLSTFVNVLSLALYALIGLFGMFVLARAFNRP